MSMMKLTGYVVMWVLGSEIALWIIWEIIKAYKDKRARHYNWLRNMDATLTTIRNDTHKIRDRLYKIAKNLGVEE